MASKQAVDLTKHLQIIFFVLKKRYEQKFPDREMRLVSTYRSPQEQKEIWQEGRDANGKIIDASAIKTQLDGTIKQSMHNFYPARAFDFGIFIKGKYMKDESYYLPVGEMCKDLAVEWGGNWKTFKDYPHIQSNHVL